LHDWRVLRETELMNNERDNGNHLGGLDFVGSPLCFGTLRCGCASDSEASVTTNAVRAFWKNSTLEEFTAPFRNELRSL
jgi:hypothetical protein